MSRCCSDGFREGGARCAQYLVTMIIAPRATQVLWYGQRCCFGCCRRLRWDSKSGPRNALFPARALTNYLMPPRYISVLPKWLWTKLLFARLLLSLLAAQ